MNNRFLGNSPTLTKTDVLINIAKSLNLPVWYITMLTEPETRNKGDRNATNYRMGSKNTALLELIKSQFYGDDLTIIDTCDLIKKQDVSLKVITTRNNQKAGHFRIGYQTHFSNKERITYFEGVAALIAKDAGELIFLDPDTGVMTAGKKLPSHKGNSFVLSSEIKMLLDAVNEDSVLMVSQSLTNHLITHENRVKELQQDLQCDILLVVDEVIQSGIYFIAKKQAMHETLSNLLWEYLTQYQMVKSNERVMIISCDKNVVTTKSLGTAPNKNETKP